MGRARRWLSAVVLIWTSIVSHAVAASQEVFRGTGTTVWSGCRDKDENGQHIYSALVELRRSSAGSLVGSFTVNYEHTEAQVYEEGTLRGTYALTSASSWSISGTSEATLFAASSDDLNDIEALSTSAARFLGTVRNGQLDANYTGRDTTGDTCRFETRFRGFAVLPRPKLEVMVVVPGINDDGEGLVNLAKLVAGCHVRAVRTCTVHTISERSGSIGPLLHLLGALIDRPGNRTIIVNVDMHLEISTAPELYFLTYLRFDRHAPWKISTLWAGDMINQVARASVGYGLPVQLFAHSAGVDAVRRSFERIARCHFRSIHLINGRVLAHDLAKVLKCPGDRVKVFTSRFDYPALAELSLSTFAASQRQAKRRKWQHWHAYLPKIKSELAHGYIINFPSVRQVYDVTWRMSDVVRRRATLVQAIESVSD